MQWLILKIAWLMQFTLGTSATESMVAAGMLLLLLKGDDARGARPGSTLTGTLCRP